MNDLFLNRYRPEEPIALVLIGHPHARHKIASGIYTCRERLIEDIRAYDGLCNVYANLNRLQAFPVDWRADNRVMFDCGWRFNTHNVERRTGLFFDIDAVRDQPRANEQQLKAANDLADRLRETLGEPQTDVMTGNGRQITYAIDLPVDSDLPERILRKQSEIFNTPGAKIDTGVHDAARIMRVPGTLNLKAQRRAELLTYSECCA